jgi:hypothetical protein
MVEKPVNHERMTMHANTLAAIVLLVVPSAAAAQGRAIGRAHASVLTVPFSASLRQTSGTEPATIFQRATSVGPRTNYWLEGAVAGGVLFAATGVYMAYGLCDEDSGSDCGPELMLSALPFGTIGAVLGGFIGSSFHKGGGVTPP